MHHPDENRRTVRMPFGQLRALVLSLIDAPGPPDGSDAGHDDGHDDDRGLEGALTCDACDDDAARELEFEARPTTYALNKPRVSTLDALIAVLPRR